MPPSASRATRSPRRSPSPTRSPAPPPGSSCAATYSLAAMDPDGLPRREPRALGGGRAGLGRARRPLQRRHPAGLALARRPRGPAAGSHRARARRGAGGHRVPRRRARPAGRHAGQHRRRGGDGRRSRASAAPSSGITNVEFRAMEIEWIDQPTGERRRDPLPLGLHAARRPGRRAARDPARAQAGRPRRARRVDAPGGQPVARGTGEAHRRPRPARAAGVRRAQPVLLRRSRHVEELLDAAGFDEPTVEHVDFTMTAGTSTSGGTTWPRPPTRLRELLAAAQPGRRITRCATGSTRCSRRTSRRTGASASRPARCVAAAEA